MMMTKKKRKPKVRRVMLTNEELKQLKQGPLQHGGLTPPQQEVARRVIHGGGAVRRANS